VVLRLHPRERKVSPTRRLGGLPVGMQCLVSPRPRPNAILGPALPGPGLAVGHAWQCSHQSATWRLDCSTEEASQAPRVPIWFFPL